MEAGFGFGLISGPFTTRMPIQIGDLFAVNTNTGSSLGVAPTPGATRINWAPPVADGTSRVPDSSFANQEVAIQATVRFCVVPNLLRKKPNAARNALEAANCTAGKARKTKKRRKKKRVIAQGFAPGTSIADTTPVNFKVSKKKKRKR